MLRHTKVVFLFLIFSFLLFFSFFQATFQPYLLPADIEDAFSFSLESGFYDQDISAECILSMPHLNRMQIRYTLDGSIPDQASALYTNPLSFSPEDTLQVITLKASVYDRSNTKLGGPYTATYVLGKQLGSWSNALMASITADPDDLYSPKTGILYPMADCGPTEEDWKWFQQQNCKQRGEEWIRSAHLDLFESDGTNVISQEIGLCVDGDHGSMTHYPYSLKVLAGKEYDADQPAFQYDLFSYYNTRGTRFCHIQNFNNLVFRNGGNEYNAGISDPEQKGTMLRWQVGSRLADEAGYLVAGSRPVIVFLNGQLYSIAQLQDTYNRYNTAVKTQLNKNQLEIYKGSERECTVSGEYDDLYYSYPKIEDSPILQAENQRKLEQVLSIDELFSYYAYELLVNNTDYPKKNYAIWRTLSSSAHSPYEDGRFRFLINDLDCTWDFRYDDDLWVAYFKNIKENGTMMGSMIQVEEYKARFLNILCDQLNSGLFDKAHLEAVIDEANNSFSPIASYYYSPADEAKRQQNVLTLKESAFARKDKVRGFLEETFSPAFPYTLYVTAPREGCAIHFSTTHLIASDENFQGSYYGDYPMTLYATCNDSRVFAYWLINGEKFTTPQVTLNASLIRQGAIRVQLVTTPNAKKDGLLISEIHTQAKTEHGWVELYNASHHPIALSDYALCNDILLSPKFHLPKQLLAPGKTFVIGVTQGGRLQLKAGGQLYLTKEKNVVDSVLLPAMAASESYGRFGETNEWRYYVHPTEGAFN